MVHHRLRADSGGDREPTAKTFSEDDDIGFDPQVLEGVQFSAAPQTHLDLVADEKDSVLPAQFLDLEEEIRGRHDHASIRLDRLDEEGGDFVRWNRACEKLLDVFQSNLFGLEFAAITIWIGVGNQGQAWRLGDALLDRMTGNRHGAG